MGDSTFPTISAVSDELLGHQHHKYHFHQNNLNHHGCCNSSGFIISINPFPNKPWFSHVCSTSLLKTLWEKEKLLVTSNFTFSHSVFYPFG